MWAQSVLWTSLLGVLLLGQPENSLAEPNASSASSTLEQISSNWSRPSQWIASLLREYFSDIEWDKIDEAREQIEKFIRRFERLLNFRWPHSQQQPNEAEAEVGTATATVTTSNASSKAAHSEWDSNWAAHESKARLWSYWMSSRKNASASDASHLSASSIHEALDRVACFVGYLKLLNESEQMIAELDSSKLLSNLFAASNKKPSSWLATWWG